MALAPGAVSPAASLVRRAEAEVLPPEPRRSTFWAAVGPLAGSLGHALTWAARELLPAALRAWQESSRPAENPAVVRAQVARPAGGRQERWRHGRRSRAHARSGRFRR